MNRTKALLLAAGLGTRLRPLTESVPKCLVPIAGRPILDYWVDLLVEAGVHETMINTHAFPHLVRGYIEQVNRRVGLKLVESHEPRLLGSAGTLAANAHFADDADHVIVIYADNLSDVNLGAMIEFHRRHDNPMTMLLFHTPDPGGCGIAETDDAGRVISFVEKPRHPKSDLANAGVYVVDAATYREIAGARAFDLGFDILPKFVGRMSGWVTDGYHLDIGTLQAYEQAQNDAPALLRPRFKGPGKLRPAVFLDRDGTLIEHVHYLADPAEVRLVCGGAEALCALRGAGFACVVVTNQSAIGRGIISTGDLRSIHAEMTRQLALEGAALDGVYFCPTVPTVEDPTTVEHLDRKPGPGMLWRAAHDLGLDVGRSWMVGDMVSDVLAGRNAGCAGLILVNAGANIGGADCHLPDRLHPVADLPAAVKLILHEASVTRNTGPR